MTKVRTARWVLCALSLIPVTFVSGLFLLLTLGSGGVAVALSYISAKKFNDNIQKMIDERKEEKIKNLEKALNNMGYAPLTSAGKQEINESYEEFFKSKKF